MADLHDAIILIATDENVAFRLAKRIAAGKIRKPLVNLQHARDLIGLAEARLGEPLSIFIFGADLEPRGYN